MIKNRLKIILLTLTSSILFWLSWPPLPLVGLVFVGFIPLLKAEEITKKSGFSNFYFFCSVYFTLFLWNTFTIFWVYNTSIKAGLLINIINPILFTIPFIIYRVIKSRQGSFISYVMFTLSWVSIEYFHHNWQFAFPFLTLGNALSKYPEIIQFYEYTGVLGGSLWILVVNFSLFDALKRFNLHAYHFKSIFNTILKPLLYLTIPLLTSFFIYFNYVEKGKDYEIVSIHPNVDCRSEKYQINVDSLILKYIKLSKQQISTQTEYLIWPETAITSPIWIANLNQDKIIKSIKDNLLLNFPKTKLITGSILCETYQSTTKESPSSIPNIRFNEEFRYWYYTYNAAIQITRDDQSVPLRTKNKLVPIEETIPYARVFILLRNFIKSLGGFSFATREKNNDVFKNENGGAVTPLICYESAFGDLAREYVNKGASILLVILNEGWYKNNIGAAQFMHYASIRAIENRRSIARSSNDGISSFTNQRGEIIKSISEYQPSSIKTTLKANKSKTFYTIFGDYIGVMAVILLIPVSLFLFFKKK